MNSRVVWGVLGGMGPFASGEFLNTIYEHCLAKSEQEMPIIHLVSNPTVPDRTGLLLSGSDRLLLNNLEAGIDALLSSGATRIVICCMTMHCVIEGLPSNIRQKIISLVDVLFDSLLTIAAPHLMLCTWGARSGKAFEDHALWPSVKRFVHFLDDDDQDAVHRLIYAIKRDPRGTTCGDLTRHLRAKYKVEDFIAGCTELHLLAKREKMLYPTRSRWLDPLILISELIVAETGATRSNVRDSWISVF
jgi:aspartate racemase